MSCTIQENMEMKDITYFYDEMLLILSPNGKHILENYLDNSLISNKKKVAFNWRYCRISETNAYSVLKWGQTISWGQAKKYKKSIGNFLKILDKEDYFFIGYFKNRYGIYACGNYCYNDVLNVDVEYEWKCETTVKIMEN